MNFCYREKCNSLREIDAGIVGLSGKEETVKIIQLPKRSILADAEKNRKVVFFEKIYNNPLEKCCVVLSLSGIFRALKIEVKTVDSTAISFVIDISQGIKPTSWEEQSRN